MPYEWDEEKRAETFRERDVDFASIDRFDWDTALTRRSDRGGEIRWSSYGMVGDDLYHAVWTQRGEATRIISLRKANNRERRNYGEQSA